MTIVLDIGCADRPAAEPSVDYLVDRFHPDALYGVDPSPEMEELDYELDGTRIVLERRAAWTRGGHIYYWENGTDSRVGEGLVNWDTTVPCFDIAEWINQHQGEQIIVKIDAEGSEYPLLERLLHTGSDRLVDTILVEWHDHAFYADERRDALLAQLHPTVEEWER